MCKDCDCDIKEMQIDGNESRLVLVASLMIQYFKTS